MNILAIIQARTGSSRLPGKVLLKLGDKTVLEHVISRVNKSRFIDEAIVATTINHSDLGIVKLCADNGIRVFCGSEEDVLDRFFQLAKIVQPDQIVRVTADCPLIDHGIIDEVIQKHLDTKADYTSNVIIETYPDGEDVEVFNFESLRKAWKDSNAMSTREHVTQHIRNHPQEFKIVSHEHASNLSKKRWTLDNKEDYEFIKIIYDELYAGDPFFRMEAVLKLLEKRPELEEINAFISRNEGLKKSLREDRILDKKPEE